MFYQSKLGQDVELQNTHNVPFKSPRDVMQISTLSAQLGLGSELFDWYRDATPVPCGHLLSYLSTRTDDRLRYCTNTGSISLMFYITDRLKRLKFLDDEQTKSLYCPSLPIISSQMQKPFPSVLPKTFYQVSLGMYSKSSQRKRAKHKKTSRDKISKRNSIALSEKNHLKAEKRRFGIRKRVKTHKNKFSSRHLTFVLIWSSFFCPCFCVQQCLEYSGSYKAEASKVSS